MYVNTSKSNSKGNRNVNMLKKGHTQHVQWVVFRGTKVSYILCTIQMKTSCSVSHALGMNLTSNREFRSLDLKPVDYKSHIRTPTPSAARACEPSNTAAVRLFVPACSRTQLCELRPPCSKYRSKLLTASLSFSLSRGSVVDEGTIRLLCLRRLPSPEHAPPIAH